MSVQTTIDISRESAEKKGIEKVSGMSDEELEDFIDEHFYNFNIE